MIFEHFWINHGHGWEHGRAEYNLAQLAWNAAINEAAQIAYDISSDDCHPTDQLIGAERVYSAIKTQLRPVPDKKP